MSVFPEWPPWEMTVASELVAETGTLWATMARLVSVRPYARSGIPSALKSEPKTGMRELPVVKYSLGP